ncbi:ABC transporter permease [Acetobacteraceae bacterium H6797]|nr:ABC transporter permease [Acetobacteraceae bacterium H6797]
MRPGDAGFWLVFWRELRWLRRRPLLLTVLTVVPLTLMAVLTAIFSAGLATRLPIAVLDLDGSDLSRRIIRLVDATPDTAVAWRVTDLAEGRAMILSGEARGLLLLPRRLEQDTLSGRQPEVVFFYNAQTMTTGNLVLRGVNAAVPAAAAAAGLRLSLRTARGEVTPIATAALSPIPVQTSGLFNPALNYAHFLLAALLPGMLQILAVISTAYAAGLDLEVPWRARVLRRLGGGLLPALAGKLLPYTLLLLLLLGLSDLALFSWLELPLRGQAALLLLAALLFILACQLLGVVLALWLKPMGRAISIGTLLTAPAFGFMGISFPRLGMNDFAHAWGALLPGTWYLMARIDQTLRGTPHAFSTPPLLVLAAFVLALSALVCWQLERQGERP